MTVETTAISRPRPPDLIPGYRLERLVGKGGMGEVHRATQLSLGRTVAVKLLAADLALDKAFVTRFEKEAAALAALSHPHIVAIVDKGKAKETYFLVMEFIDGPSLREVMRSPLLDSAGSLKIALEICRAIDYAHGRGVIHRDLKPENILFDEQAGGIPKVTDFGLASFVVAEPTKFNVTETHVSMGTLSYMSPEQRVDAKSADHRADIYSLGVILYELLVGEVPVGNYDPPSQKKAGVDRRLDDIVAKCLKPNPADRYASVGDLISELEPLAPITFSLRPHKVSRVERAKLAVQRAVRIATRSASIALVAVAAVVLGVWTLRSKSPAVGIETMNALSQTLPDRGRLEPLGRISESSEARTITVGEGPDAIPFVARGRLPTLDGKQLRFAAPESKAPIGRVMLDVSDSDAQQVVASVEVFVQPPDEGFFARLRGTLFGVRSHPRAALAFRSSDERYAALVVSGDGAPVSFEWALAEKRAAMAVSSLVTEGFTRLELVLDKDGDLRAFVGAGKDRRAVGEPIRLTASWRRYFERAPVPELACIEAACQFRRIVYELKREPPPAPVALVPAKPAPVVKPASAKKPVVAQAKKPAHKAPVVVRKTKRR